MRQLPYLVTALALVLLASACDNPEEPSDAPTIDAPEALVPDAPDDAGAAMDVSMPLDTPEPVDGGPTDAVESLDGGVPDDTGLLDTPASPPDAPDAPPFVGCTPAGATRLAACGMCGMRQETCSVSGAWEGTTACVGEGACTPGAAETRSTPGCGQETRLCDATCGWSAWLRSMPDVGVCEVGETRFRPDAAACGPYLVNRETCSSTCEWAVTTACTDECGGTARTSPAWAIERCIPAGTFIRGRNDASADQGPEAEIYISAFYLDVFTVTNDRYRACVADGGCGALTTSFTTASAVSSYNNPARGAYPLEHISRTAASRFCEWDGRRLATDAELAKAARGPAPRRNLYPWGTIYDCADFGWCTWSMGTFVHDVAYDGLPETRSYYGIERLLAGGYEYTSDPYRENYYTTDASRVPDPPGPTGAASQVRGSRPRLPTSVTVRNQLGTQDVGFRCGRSVSGGM